VQARVVQAGAGRIVQLESSELPSLPRDQIYEVWFVGGGDAPGHPERISAGTFTPDDRGHTSVQLAAAVDPDRYMTLAVTAEPDDGDPGARGPVVLGTALAP
jgi:anti-sigma-K factor RskA